MQNHETTATPTPPAPAKPRPWLFSDEFAAFLAGYLEAAEKLHTDDDGNDPETTPDIAPEGREQAAAHCAVFLAQAAPVLRRFLDSANVELSQAGIDFFLCRNGHGSGFWDRPRVPGHPGDEADEDEAARLEAAHDEDAQTLTAMAESFGEIYTTETPAGLVFDIFYIPQTGAA